jgi:hypothetical protein
MPEDGTSRDLGFRNVNGPSLIGDVAINELVEWQRF